MPDEAQQSRAIILPRVTQEFIGLGSKLTGSKKMRKQIEIQQQAMENPVSHLEKQKAKVQKNYKVQKKKIQQFLTVKQRQQADRSQVHIVRLKRVKVRKLREMQLQALKKHNEMMRIIQKTNVHNNRQQLISKNHSDYSYVRQRKIEGEKQKKHNKFRDLSQKRDHWISLNIEKQRGKMRINNYYKQRNRQYIESYKSRIKLEQQLTLQKTNHIRSLQAKQQTLRKQIQSNSIKSSRLAQIYQSVSENTEIDTRSIEAELYGTNIKSSNKTIDVTNRQSNTARQKSNDEIQENIELGDEQIDLQGFRRINLKKRNKHRNRYRQYQAF